MGGLKEGPGVGGGAVRVANVGVVCGGAGAAPGVTVHAPEQASLYERTAAGAHETRSARAGRRKGAAHASSVCRVKKVS